MKLEVVTTSTHIISWRNKAFKVATADRRIVLNSSGALYRTKNKCNTMSTTVKSETSTDNDEKNDNVNISKSIDEQRQNIANDTLDNNNDNNPNIKTTSPSDAVIIENEENHTETIQNDQNDSQQQPQQEVATLNESIDTSGVNTDGDDDDDKNTISLIDNSISMIQNESYINDVDDDLDDKKYNDYDDDAKTTASSNSNNNNIDDQMPLFHYSRLYGSIPRSMTNNNILESRCTCTTMGKVVLTAETTVLPTTTNDTSLPGTAAAEPNNTSSPLAISASSDTTVTRNVENSVTNIANQQNEYDEHDDDVYDNNVANDDQTSLYMNETISLLGMGLQDGHVLLLDAQTGMSVLNSGTTNSTASTSSTSVMSNSNTTSASATKPFFRVRENQTTSNVVPISSVSFDSSGTSFGAIDDGGMCCIWTMKYKVQMRKHQYEFSNSTQNQQHQQEHQPTQSSSESSATAVPILVESTDTNSTTTATASTSQPKQQQPAGNVFSNMVSSAFSWPGTKQKQQQDKATSSSAIVSNPEITDVASTTVTSAERTTTQQTQAAATTTTRYKYVPTLTIGEMKMNRINYPKSFGTPTCLVLDPAYSNKNRGNRDTSLIVAFDDGKIVYSKRGWGLLQRRDDKFIQYTTTPVVHDKEFNGIESIVWRGSIIAFADCSGIRLYDIELFQPIALIDRPTGARPTLYPGITVKPNLCFESSTSLLVAWGDCLLAIRIHESNSTISSSRRQLQVSNTDTSVVPNATPSLQDNTAAAADQPSPPAETTTSNNNTINNSAVPKKRVVECCMAWALDCVACGVTPLDENHLIILGQVLPSDDDDFDDDESDDFNRDDQVEGADCEPYSIVRVSDVKHEYQIKNEIELQVISRLNGSIIYSDILPLLHRQPTNQATIGMSFNTKNDRPTSTVLETYSMLSSFAVPRMENSLELLEEFKITEAYRSGNDAPQMPLSSTLYGRQYKSSYFEDSHIRWNLRMIAYDHDDETKAIVHSIPNNQDDSKEPDLDDNDLYDDDYGFIFRPIGSLVNAKAKSKVAASGNTIGSVLASPPPLVVIVSGADAVVARTRDIDDAISYTIKQRRKPATALRMAIQNMTSLRRHSINELVNYYFRALLRLDTEVVTTGSMINIYNKIDGTSSDVLEAIDNTRDTRQQKTLSLRRMKLAAEAMPILLGTNVDMWEYWISELERVPGALFVVRNHLPVRGMDPIILFT
jgi:hypothetical protein